MFLFLPFEFLPLVKTPPPAFHNPENYSEDKYEKAAGWRLLRVDELAATPADAQFFHDGDGEWTVRDTCMVGQWAFPDITYRTRAPDKHAVPVVPHVHNPDNLTPEQYGAARGWRLLRLGEPREDCEYTLSGGREWRLWDMPGEEVTNKCFFTYRTRRPDPYAAKPAPAPAADDGWVKVSDRKAKEADLPVWFWNEHTPNKKPFLASDLYNFSSTHWRKAEQPPKPPAIPTQKEKDVSAFNAWSRGRLFTGDPVSCINSALDAFFAGCAHARTTTTAS